jgi:hypothetical protein
MCITLHLLVLNRICHFAAQWPRVARSIYSSTLSVTAPAVSWLS